MSNARFCVMTKDFHEAAKALKPLLPPKNKHSLYRPYDTHARITTAFGDRITLGFHSLATGITARVDVGAVVREHGEASVNLRDLCELLATYDNERADCEFDSAAQTFTLKAHRDNTSFKAYEKPENLLPLGEIPVGDEWQDVTVQAQGANLNFTTKRGEICYPAAAFDKLLPLHDIVSAAFTPERLHFTTHKTYKAFKPVKRGLRVPPRTLIVTYSLFAKPARLDVSALALTLRSFRRATVPTGVTLYGANPYDGAVFLIPEGDSTRLVWRYKEWNQPAVLVRHEDCLSMPISQALYLLGHAA